MANLIEEAKTRIDELLRDACRRAAAEGLFPEDAELRGTVEIPKDARNGDYAANHAMASPRSSRSIWSWRAAGLTPPRSRDRAF